MTHQPNVPSIGADPPLAIIDTPRLTLRARNADDACALFPAMSDAKLMRWWSHPPFQSRAELREHFRPQAGSSWREWAITRKGSNAPIGFVAAGQKRDGVSEIGYLLTREAQGQGIAREAVTALIDVLFREGQHRVFADTDPDNVDSIGLLTRLGFRLEGHLRHEWRTHIGLRDSLIFGLIAEEWTC